MTPIRPTKTSSIYSTLQVPGYEQVEVCKDPETGLKSIVSIHSTQLGPSLGGCRFYSYKTEEEAITDSKNLAKAMTFKASLAGLNLGGGKAVIIGNPTTDKTDQLWKAYANFVEHLGGKYITTVDSGTSPSDMDIVRKFTKYVVGMNPAQGGSGDPSPTTAIGVAEGIRACAKFAYGSDSLSGKRIAVQGIGHVGFPLAKRLKMLGAQLIVGEKNEVMGKKATTELGAEVVDPQAIFSVKCDIFSPCAMGGAINAETLPKLKCDIVAGAANNPLSSQEIGEELHKKGILYAPDFAINAGGLIHVSSEWNGFDAKAVDEKARQIYHTIFTILKRARDENRSPAHLAMTLATERLKQ